MEAPSSEQTFGEFKSRLVSMIERPSEHSVDVVIEDETHKVRVSAHGSVLFRR